MKKTLRERIAAAKGKPAEHRHICYVCRQAYPCPYINEKKPEKSDKFGSLADCKITQAAKVNGIGPYCDRCRKAVMKERREELRRAKETIPA